jgi:hypothetical protein
MSPLRAAAGKGPGYLTDYYLYVNDNNSLPQCAGATSAFATAVATFATGVLPLTFAATLTTAFALRTVTTFGAVTATLATASTAAIAATAVAAFFLGRRGFAGGCRHRGCFGLAAKEILEPTHKTC